ncbi:hypothetical protein LOK49_LG06G03248 [Camellia lanceoleosa]|uniref:Uncharacterized protein n=1 Tax=Camellia lanceoleosa TaxID=1840588 RepID=A0ACC0HDQ4_9ERIC|nr:hypothetical protein LOK49_LG06G03248 [Camellia lanceoleosa]
MENNQSTLMIPTYHVSENPKGKLYFMYEGEGEKIAGAVLSTPPPVTAAMSSFTACCPPPIMGPHLCGPAAAAAGQYNAPNPPPAMMEPAPSVYGYEYGQAEHAKKNKVGTIGGWVGRVFAWVGRVFAGAVISDIINNVSGDIGA